MFFFISLVIATCSGQFSRMIGGAFGVNIAAVIFNYYSQTSLNQLQGKFHTTSTFESLGMIKYLPPMLQQEIRVAFLNSTNKVYILGKHPIFYLIYLKSLMPRQVVIASGVGFLASLAVKNTKIPTKPRTESKIASLFKKTKS
jgi:hypothetical protein